MLIVKSSRLPQRGARSPQAMVGTGMPLHSVREGSQAEQEVPCCLLEAGTMMLVKHFESSPVLLSPPALLEAACAHTVVR